MYICTQNDIYNELMNPNLGVQLLLFWVFVVLVIAIPIQVLTDQLIESTAVKLLEIT